MLDERTFWARVAIDGPHECWAWQAGKDTRGYGKVRWNGESQLAHRVAYELTFGAIPAGANVLQDCRNPACCNPAHLRIGTMSPRRKQRALPAQPAVRSKRPLPSELARENERLKARVSELEEVIRDLERR